ncbi:MAG: methyltransferase domain-containing protein [Cyanothece sp. SIO2G6]|nr:methyltransferase domain-containing protein [Cyanothece sp. SIO2G6]
MRKLLYDEFWPESWKYSYFYDCIEINGSKKSLGYAYAYQQRTKHTLELIQKVAKSGAKVLDIAAAQGNFSLRLAELGYEVTWNDLRDELVDYVKLKHEKGVIHYWPGNILDLDTNHDFDVVLLAEVIEHVAHPDQLLKKVAEFVKPGGYIVMTTPNGEYFRNRLPRFSDCSDPARFESVQFKPNADGHIFLLHTDEICQITQSANLTLEEIRLFTNSLTNGHIKLGMLLKLWPQSWVYAVESLTQKLPQTLKRKLTTSAAALIRC